MNRKRKAPKQFRFGAGSDDVEAAVAPGNGAECIEVASPDGAVAVRDTKQDDTGPALRSTPAAWRRFAA